MKVEELEIIVTAKVEESIKQFKKVVPEIKKVVQQAQESFQKMDTKVMTNKVKEAVQSIKRKMQDLKRSNKDNEIKISINNKDAQKQISQVQKEIASLQRKIESRQMKLKITNNAIDKITEDTSREVKKDMPNAGNKKIKQETYSRLADNSNYNSLIKQSSKLNNEISSYDLLLKTAKNEMGELGTKTEETSEGQSKNTNLFGSFKTKLDEAKIKVGGFKNGFSNIPKIAQSIGSHIKGMGAGLKQGIVNILSYAKNLFSLQNIYSTLSNSAQSWLSSQNADAQQLSTNIEYMKYAMGGVFAPVIQFVTNLVYQLMKAIQSVAYALTGVNIFAKASASSYAGMAGSASKAKKETQSLAGIHSEINNVQSNDNSDSGGGGGSIAPSFDLSQIDNTPNKIIEAIKNGEWNQVGSLMGEKLNEAMYSIPWDQIQNGAKSIASNIAQFTNGFIATTDWNQVGNTFAQGINTIIYFAHSFITTFDWSQFGTAIGDSINGFFNNIDWAIAGQTLSGGIKGIFDSINSFFEEVNWNEIGENIKLFIQNIDWPGIWESIKEMIKNASGAIDGILTGLFGEDTASIIEAIAIAIGAVTIALTLLNIILSTNIITLIIMAIIAVIALCIVYWEDICNVVSTVVNSIVEFITNLWNKISIIFGAIKVVISTVLGYIWNIFSAVFQTIWSIVSSVLDAIWKIISTIFQAIWNIISSILNSIWNIFSQIFNWIWQLISKVFQEIWNIIAPIINKIWETIKFVLGKIQETWSSIWNTISNVVKNIWNSIWSTIKNIINSILGGIESFINGTIKGVNKLLKGISDVANAIGSLIGLDPINLQINTISLPRLAKGGVLTEATTVIAGEYLGARSNPEIITPQNIMYDTMLRAISNSNIKENDNNRPIRVQIYWGTRNVVDEIIEGINDKTRKTGKTQIKVAYD